MITIVFFGADTSEKQGLRRSEGEAKATEEKEKQNQAWEHEKEPLREKGRK